MREIDPVGLGDNLHQIVFDLFGRVLPGQAEAAAQAVNMRVNHNPFSFAVRDAEDDTGGFAAAAGQLDEFGHRVGHLPGMTLGNGLTTIADGFGFVAEETGGFDAFLQLSGRRGGELGRRPVFGEEGGRDLIDAFVGALGAEDGGDEELERVGVVEFAVHVGVGGAQDAADLFGANRYFGLGRIHANIV